MRRLLHKLYKRREVFWTVFLATAFGLIAIALLLPAVNGRPPGPKAYCNANIRQLALALHLYEDEHGCLPPSFVVDENGKPMHSWRTLILPYIEEDSLYAAYDFDEPWNGPNNRKHAKHFPEVFRCPADKNGEYTNFLAVVGPNTMWRENGPITLESIPDEGSQTIAIVEVADSGIHWMEPRDLHVVQMARGINPAVGQGISSNHRQGANVAFADASVRFLRNDTPLERLEALLTINDGENVSE